MNKIWLFFQSAFKKVPGLRSDTWWKKLIAIAGYGFTISIILVVLFPPAPSLSINKTPPTNLNSAEITGETSSDKPVFLYQNGEEIIKVESDSDGKFAFHIKDLKEGSYTYKVKVCDSEKQEKCSSQQTTLLVDKTPPQEPETKPISKTIESGTLSLTGICEPQVEVNILVGDNEYQTKSDDQGSFTQDIPLAVGNNTVTFWAEDQAGNKSQRIDLEVERIKTTFKVTKVIDGDTINVEGGETVRYIGIDSPETNRSTLDLECFAQKATEKNKQLVEDKTVRLEKDISETDQYGRLLRYVYIDDTFVNKKLVEEGYATAVSYPPDIKHQEELLDAERQAREEEKGLWKECIELTPTPTVRATITPTPASTYQPTPTHTLTPTSTPTPTPTPESTSGGGCLYSCGGPDKDCSDFTTHAQAQNFFECCGFTASYDPMRLDSLGTGNGIACESLP